METHIPFHQWIEAKRKEVRLTRQDAVDRMNAVYRNDPYGLSAWRMWEDRAARPSYERCDRIAAGLGIPKQEVYAAAGLLSPTEQKRAVINTKFASLTEEQQNAVDTIIDQFMVANQKRLK